jgi:hypothetical protein
VRKEIARSVVAVLGSALFALALGSVSCIEKVPELTKSNAATLISEAPKFSGSRTLLSVDGVYPGPYSDRKWALARFTFRSASSPSLGTLNATAQFRYRDGRWRIQLFRYGEGYGNIGVETQ